MPPDEFAAAAAFRSLIALMWRKRWPAGAAMYCYAVVAGMVAGKGLGGIANAVLQIAGVSGAFRGTSIGCPLNEYCG